MAEIPDQGPIFNWGAIIDEQQEVYFFMSSYTMDTICGGQHFLGMNWVWRKGLPPIHVYCLELWEIKYK